MHATHTTERLAAIAHDLWQDAMLAEGWTHGPIFDPRAKHHDALVPFPKLGKYDLRQALLGIRALELEPPLVGALWYERGPARLLTLEEMQPGFRVGWNTELAAPGPDAPPEPGEVVTWKTDGEGFLCSVTVAWADGSRSNHHPEARELRRLEHRPVPRDHDGRA